MVRIIPNTIIIVIMVSAAVFAAGPNDITYMTEQYPPYNFEADGKIQGISTDVMRAIMKRLNVDRPIRMLPWANAYNRVQAIANTCLFSMTYTPERAPLFKWVGPVAYSNITLVALKKNNIRINNIEEVNKYRVGVIRSDIGEQLLLKAGVKPDHIDAVAHTIQNLKKLVAGRVKLVAYGDEPLKWEIKQNGFTPDDFQTVFRLSKGELFFAFHKNTPETIIKDFQRVLDELKSDGTYGRIVDKYLK